MSKGRTMTTNVPEVVIKSSIDVTTTWSRNIELEYYGHIYGVVLEWGPCHGFRISWTDRNGVKIETPGWAPSDNDLLHLAIDWQTVRRTESAHR